jgi:hypothetical protein
MLASETAVALRSLELAALRITPPFLANSSEEIPVKKENKSGSLSVTSTFNGGH